MLEVYQKRTFIEIDTNIRKFSAIFLNVAFKESAYYWENEKMFFLHSGARALARHRSTIAKEIW